MTMRHCDNFSMYHSGEAVDMLDGVYAQIQAKVSVNSVYLVADPDGISTGQVCRINESVTDGNWSILRYVLPSNQDTVGVANRVWLPQLPQDIRNFPTIISWRDASNVQIAALCVDTTGRLYIATGADDDSHTILTRTSTPVITAAAWYHIESKLLYGGSGNITVRVEGVEVLNYDHSFTTTDGNIYQLQWMNHGISGIGTADMYIKDLVIWDGAGTQNNNFLGPVLVYSCAPTSDVALNWTPTGAANGYSILDNAPFDDTKHLDAPTPAPSPYQGGLADLPADVTSVKAVMTFVRAAKSDGGDATLQTSVVSGASTALGSDRPITVAQTYWTDVQELDPATSSPWTPTAVNAAKIKLNRTT
jgi:hypothetical protein